MASMVPDSATRLLDAAEEAFARHGYSGATTAGIATRAGVTKALVHYYFRTKKSLHQAVMERYEQRLGEPLLEELEKQDPLVALNAAMRRYCAFLAANPRYVRLTLFNALEGNRTLDDTPLFRRLVDATTAALERGMEQGLLRAEDARHMLISIDSLCSYFFEHQTEFEALWREDPLDRQRLIEERIDHVVRAVTAAFCRAASPMRAPAGETPVRREVDGGT